MDNRLNRRQFVKKITFSTAAALFAGHYSSLFADSCQKKPNIIIIMADDMGYGDVSVYNPDSKINTPNMDRLAKQGMMFTDAHSTNALCTPTRYSLLTGRYCWRTKLKKGVLLSFDPLLIDTNRMTVASMLKKNGYATALIGKWHLGLGNEQPTDYDKALKPGPLELGFDYFFGLPGSLAMRPWCFVENHHVVGELQGEKKTIVYGEGQSVPGWKHEDVGPKITAKAIDFIEQNVKERPDKPFYLHLMASAPHRPCTPPDFAKDRTQAGPRGDMVWEYDWTVGQIMKTLEKYNLSENTLIVVTSDNGAIPGRQLGPANQTREWELYNHKSCGDWRGFKTHIWDGGHRVPFIARWTGKIKPGQVSKETTCLADWMATCADIVGQKLPNNAAEDSYSILPVLLGKDYQKPLREATVLQGAKTNLSIRQGPWKLIEGTGSGGQSDRDHIGPQSKPLEPGCDPEGQLYNLDKDPQETENLWCKEPEMVKKLTALLERYKKQGYSRPM